MSTKGYNAVDLERWPQTWAAAIRSRHLWKGYVVSLGSVLICAALRWWADPVLNENLPFAFFIAPVVVTSWLGGLRPSLLATALSTVSGWWFIQPQQASPSFWATQWMAVGSYVLTALLICWYAERMRRANWKIQECAATNREQQKALAAQMEELKWASEALSESEHRYRLAWEASQRATDELSNLVKERTAEVERLRDKLQAENVYLRERVRSNSSGHRIVGKSQAILGALAQAEQVAKTDATVLLLGETGTGKELLATWIHELSSRGNKPLVSVNCAIMPAALVESELFGREKGAFTGSLSRQIGRFELADASTIFLDEVGELPAEAQAKLLRVLEAKQIERLGNPRPIAVDVRIIAATNRNLEQAVQEGGFRQDLFYRLNVFPITVPPLRERREDIFPLVWACVDEFARAFNKNIESIDRESMNALQRYSWPGNVREMRNLIERAMIVATGPRLRIELPQTRPPAAEPAAPLCPSQRIEDIEREHILAMLTDTGWRVRGINGAAQKLGMKPTTLEARMRRLGIRRPAAAA